MAIGPQGNMFSLMDLLMIIIEETLIVSDVNVVTALSLSCGYGDASLIHTD